MGGACITANRVRIGDYFGAVSHPHVSFNILADDVWRAAVRRGGVSGLRRYQFDNGSLEKGSADDHKLPAAAIGLSYRPIYPVDWNTLANWGNPTNAVAEVPNLFNDGGTGLEQYDATPNPTTPYTYQAAHTIALNQAHILRVTFAKIPEPSSGQPKQISLFRYEWGGVWRYEIRDEQSRLRRLTANYTDALSSELDTLIALETPTPTQEARIGEIQSLIFEIDQSLSLPSGHQNQFHEPATLVFMAEPRGVVRIECLETGHFESVTVPSLLKARLKTDSPTTNTVWAASRPVVKAYGGVFAWQVGRPQFATVGTLKLGRFAPGFAAGTVPTRGQWDISFPGTSVSFVNVHIEPDPKPPLWTVTGATAPPQIDEFTATLTGSGLYTPFLYSAQAFAPAAPRVGTAATIWDSDNYLIFGTSAIMDVTPSCDRDGRRMSFTVVLRCVNNADGTNQLGAWKDCHDRTIYLESNGVLICSLGLIKSVVYNSMATVAVGTAAGVAAEVAKPAPGATLTLEVGDPWAILDDDLMPDDPIGDGLWLSDYLRTVLQGAGFYIPELGGIPSSEFVLGARLGRRLPRAALGENFAVRPSPGTRRSDFLHDLIVKYGNGLELWWDSVAVRWVLDFPSTVVKAAFSSALNTPIPYRIEAPLDIVHDYSDTYNIISVQGANDENGQPIVRTWTVWEGFKAPNNYTYVGRIKRMATVQDDALRTSDDVLIVLRNLVAKHTRPGRFAQFSTWYIENLFPGDRVLVDGVAGEIERIGIGGIAGRAVTVDGRRWSGKMQPVVRLLQTGEKPSG